MQRCISEIRTLSYLLHPPTMDDAGLASAARWYVEGFGQRSGLKVRLDAPFDLGRLPDAVELALFRVLQETLTNVHRHSGASAADILMLIEGNQLILEIKDDGRGMQPEVVSRFCATGAGMGIGLTSIRERVRELGGRLKLESNANGTLLRVTIPITSNAATAPQVVAEVPPVSTEGDGSVWGSKGRKRRGTLTFQPSPES
jgi:signal transduction histidine kinase